MNPNSAQHHTETAPAWGPGHGAPVPPRKSGKGRTVALAVGGGVVLFSLGAVVGGAGQTEKTVVKHVSTATSKPAAKAEQEPMEASVEPVENSSLVLGKDSARMKNGLDITPSAPEKFSSDGMGVSTYNYVVTVKFTNKGQENIDLGDVMAKAMTDGGATNTITDSANDVGMSLDAGRIAPGQSATLKYGFSAEKKPTYVNYDFKMFLKDSVEFTYNFS